MNQIHVDKKGSGSDCEQRGSALGGARQPNIDLAGQAGTRTATRGTAVGKRQSQTPNECLICRSIDIAASVYRPWVKY